MGFIAKQLTKSRVAPSTHPTTLSPKWGAEGMPRLAAIARGAAMLLARAGLHSSGHRGGDSLGIISFARSANSSVWVEQSGFETWSVALGVETVAGPAYDWKLQIHATLGPGSVAVDLATPTVLTRDGSQIHQDQWVQTRDAVVAGLTAQRPPAVDHEVAVSAGSFGGTAFDLVDKNIEVGDFTVRTELGREAARARLRALPYTAVDSGEDDLRWRVGATGTPESWVGMRATPAAEGTLLTFRTHLGADVVTVATVTAARHARQFKVMTEQLLGA